MGVSPPYFSTKLRPVRSSKKKKLKGAFLDDRPPPPYLKVGSASDFHPRSLILLTGLEKRLLEWKLSEL